MLTSPAKQPVCTPEQARELLIGLKAAYQSLGANERVAIGSEIECQAMAQALDEEQALDEQIIAEQNRVLALSRPDIFAEFRSGRASDQVYQLLALRYTKGVLLSFAEGNPRLNREVEFWTGPFGIEYVGYDANF
jgi:hypothetical protein